MFTKFSLNCHLVERLPNRIRFKMNNPHMENDCKKKKILFLDMIIISPPLGKLMFFLTINKRTNLTIGFLMIQTKFSAVNVFHHLFNRKKLDIQ